MPLTAPIIAHVIAVHVDARQRQVARPTVPKIRLPKGTDAVIALHVRESDNDRADITGAVVILTVRTAVSDATPLISRLGTIVDGPDGECEFPIAQSDTAEAALGAYLYSVEATWPSGDREQLVRMTAFDVIATVGVGGEPVTSPVPEVILGYGVALRKAGSADFTDETEVDVAFDEEFPDTAYSIDLGASVDESAGTIPSCAWADKTAAGFTIKVTGSFTGTVDWSANAHGS